MKRELALKYLRMTNGQLLGEIARLSSVIESLKSVNQQLQDIIVNCNDLKTEHTK